MLKLHRPAPRWRLPNPRSEQALELHTHLTTVPLPSLSTERDSYHWSVNGVTMQGYSSAKTWDSIIPRADVKDWAKVVWFIGAVPKHAFYMWIVNYDRLPTRVRLASWRLQIPTTCCLCSHYPENRDHLLLTVSTALPYGSVSC